MSLGASLREARVTGQLAFDGLDHGRGAGLTDRRRGPKGSRVGDIVIADGSRWRVLDIDPERREAICRLEAGSRASHRFRARQITAVERGR